MNKVGYYRFWPKHDFRYINKKLNNTVLKSVSSLPQSNHPCLILFTFTSKVFCLPY